MPAHPKDFAELKRAVISAVERDAEAFRRTKSWLATILPDRLGVTGSVRNFGFAFANTFSGGRLADPTGAKIEALVCTGIASATAKAINNAKIPGVMASTINRFRPLDHTATLVYWLPPDPPGLGPKTTQWIAQNSGPGKAIKPAEWVFDWHHTLNPSNPTVLSKSSWMSGG